MKASFRNFDREKKERVFLQDDKFMTSHYPEWVVCTCGSWPAFCVRGDLFNGLLPYVALSL